MARVFAERSDDIAIWNRGFGQTIGGALPLHFEHVAMDRVVMTMHVDHRTHQPMGILHGGASLVLAESAASTGANLACPAGMVAVGQEINANHLRPKTEGVLTATALPLHIGRTTQVWSVEIRDEAGNLVCISRCTLAVIAAPRPAHTERARSDAVTGGAWIDAGQEEGTTEMHYYVEKSIEYRLEEAERAQRNVDFVREARALRQRGRPAMLRSLTSRFTNWTPIRVRGQARDGGVA